MDTQSAAPTPEQIEAAKKEWTEATDRMAIVKKYPFLQTVLPDFQQVKPAPIGVEPAPNNGVKASPSNNQPSSTNS